MRKVMAIMLTAALLLCFAGCVGSDNTQTATTTGAPTTTQPTGGVTSNQEESTTTVPTTLPTQGDVTPVACTHASVSKATCEEPSVCLACGATIKAALGHSFYNGKCLRLNCGAADPNGPAVKSVKLDQTKASMTVGSTVQLNATVKPDGASVSWASSNAKVATVDASGKVTAVGIGKAEIKVSGANGIYAVCDVTVDHVALTMKNAFPDGTDETAIEVAYNSDYSLKVKTYYAIRGLSYSYEQGSKTLKVSFEGHISYNSQGSPKPTTPSFCWRVVAADGTVVGEGTWKGDHADSPPAQYNDTFSVANVVPGTYELVIYDSYVA